MTENPGEKWPADGNPGTPVDGELACVADGRAKDMAPSTELRKWFDHDPAKWDAFKGRYFRELDEQSEAVERLLARGHERTDPNLWGQGHAMQQCRRPQGIPRAARREIGESEDDGNLAENYANLEFIPRSRRLDDEPAMRRNAT
jgi:hypothetical protein